MFAQIEYFKWGWNLVFLLSLFLFQIEWFIKKKFVLEIWVNLRCILRMSNLKRLLNCFISSQQDLTTQRPFSSSSMSQISTSTFHRVKKNFKCEIKKNLSTWLNIISTTWLHNFGTLYKYLCIKFLIHWFQMENVLPAAH